MRLRVQSSLRVHAPSQTDLIAKIEVAQIPGQTVLRESLETEPRLDLRRLTDAHDGSRTLVGAVAGPVDIAYSADVELLPRQPVPDTARQLGWAELPADVLPFLLASRYCPSDKFGRFAARELGSTAGGARVNAILAWIARNIDYLHGVSDAEIAAERTFVDRAGVCRDFAHLAVTLARASGIPARTVAAYAWQLEPQDFHAVPEFYLEGGWWLADATGLAPIDGLVRIAHGRDAADIAFLTTSGETSVEAMSIAVTSLEVAAAA